MRVEICLHGLLACRFFYARGLHQMQMLETACFGGVSILFYSILYGLYRISFPHVWR